MVTLDESDKPQSVALAVGETVEIRMPVQSGTGYGWQVSSAESAGYSIAPGTGDTETDRPGAPVYQTFQIEATRPGSYRIEFSYARPWEKGATPAKTLTIALDVSE